MRVAEVFLARVKSRMKIKKQHVQSFFRFCYSFLYCKTFPWCVPLPISTKNTSRYLSTESVYDLFVHSKKTLFRLENWSEQFNNKAVNKHRRNNQCCCGNRKYNCLGRITLNDVLVFILIVQTALRKAVKGSNWINQVAEKRSKIDMGSVVKRGENCFLDER